MMGGSQMGLGSRAHSTIPSLVAFPDQAPYTTWLGDKGLKLTTLTQFHRYLQEELEQFNQVDQRVI